jgi:hypothetical protein
MKWKPPFRGHSGTGAGERPSANARSLDAELPANRARRSERDLTMTWHGSAEFTARVRPDGVSWALANDLATVLGEMSLEVLTPQAAASSIVTCSVWPPPIGGSRPSSRYEAIISCAASNNISRASSTVRPQVTTAGHSASCAIVQPFSSGVKTAVSVTVSATSSVCPHTKYLSAVISGHWPTRVLSPLDQAPYTSTSTQPPSRALRTAASIVATPRWPSWNVGNGRCGLPATAA